MVLLKRLLDFYISTSIHVAVAVFSLVQVTKISLNITTNYDLDFFIFLGTILGYNFLKYHQVFWDRVFSFNKNYSIVVVSFLAVFCASIFYFNLESELQIMFLKIAFLVIIYPFIRKFPLLKMVFVSFCLTLITVFVLQSNQILNFNYLSQRFLIVFCLLIPLEICDITFDAKTIKTLPQIIGVKNLKMLGYFLLIVVLGLNYLYNNNSSFDFRSFFINLTIAFIIAGFIFFSNANRSKYYTIFWVESLPILWWFLLLLFT